MKKLIFTLAIAAFFVSCENKTENNSTDKQNVEAIETEEYVIPEIQLADFDGKAGDYVDKEVKVTGIVDHLCKHGGKKLFLVNDDADVHVEADERFDDSLIGSEVVINGVVREFRVDEGYCLKMETDNIKKHKEGEANKDEFDQKKEMIQKYRDEMKEKGVDHLSYYSLDFVSVENVPESI